MASQNALSDSSQTTSSGTTSVMATLDITEVCFSEEEVPELWGRLFPVGRYFRTLELTKDKYTFGRAEDCDYSFSSMELKNHQNYHAYSNLHFILTREQTRTGVFTFLEDKSSNGTFVNGVKVGKNKKQVLSNNDEIALLIKKNKVFVYMDPLSEDSNSFPEELKNKYTVSKILGSGACGEVRLAFANGNCHPLAIKIISKKRFPTTDGNALLTKNVMNEVKILKSLNHPCIVKVEDVVDSEDALYIVLELVEGGELFDRIIAVGRFEEPIAKLLFYQMILATKYLHEMGITHRDLKPENILLSSHENETVIKVTDFGISKLADEKSVLKTLCGTPTYVAPEVISTAGTGRYTKAIDCWSLGVILFICLSGSPPFSYDFEMPLVKQILGGHYKFTNECWKKVSKSAKDIIRRLLTVDPEKRITLDEALKHHWLQDEEMIRKANRLMNPPDKSRLTRKRKRSVEENDLTIDQTTDGKRQGTDNCTDSNSSIVGDS